MSDNILIKYNLCDLYYLYFDIWSVISNFSQIYEIFCRDKTYLKITYDILPDILPVTNMMVIGNFEVMPDKIKHCKKIMHINGLFYSF